MTKNDVRNLMFDLSLAEDDAIAASRGVVEAERSLFAARSRLNAAKAAIERAMVSCAKEEATQATEAA